MAQFSTESMRPPGSILAGNQYGSEEDPDYLGKMDFSKNALTRKSLMVIPVPRL